MFHSRDDDSAVTELALLAGQGDSAALNEFIRRTHKDVWRFTLYLGAADAAEDVTQDVFVRALGALPKFSGRSSARTWLLAIARHTMVDHIRRQQSRPRLAADADATKQDQLRAAPEVNTAELMTVTELIRDLSPERREALVLTQVLGYSYAEAASICGCRVGTIRSRVARAREELIQLRAQAESRPDLDARASGSARILLLRRAK